MANLRICSVDRCDKPANTRGWCRAHYIRWQRHGDPLAGGTAKGEAPKFIYTVALVHEGDECLIWPYAKNEKGYGLFGTNRRGAHRVVCEETHGAPPSPEHEAAHRCGVPSCCNPRHLRWATKIENAADCLTHGTRRMGAACKSAKLTENDVREIRRLYKTIPNTVMARQFGLNAEYVSRLCNGRSWTWLK